MLEIGRVLVLELISPIMFHGVQVIGNSLLIREHIEQMFHGVLCCREQFASSKLICLFILEHIELMFYGF